VVRVREVINLGDLARDVASSLGIRAEERQQRLEVAAAANVPASADRLVLRDAVTNLVDNAIKYSPQGATIAIGVDGDREHATVTVADQADGILPQHRERVFDRFYRIDERRARAGRNRLGAGQREVGGRGERRHDRAGERLRRIGVQNQSSTRRSCDMTRLMVTFIALWALQASRPAPEVVFVCEHGAAKSVVATAYFNKLAAERNLPVRATFRGTTPQDDLSVRAVAGLKADGVAVPSGKPAAISDADVSGATHIFAIGCTLPEKAQRSGKSAGWSDVPDDQGYGPMRDAIVRHVKQLLDALQR
jgi:arsenate reductase